MWSFTSLLHTNYKVVGWCVNITNVFEYFFKWNFNKQKGSAICTALKGYLKSVVKKTVNLFYKAWGIEKVWKTCY